jgi:hypothetical protein
MWKKENWCLTRASRLCDWLIDCYTCQVVHRTCRFIRKYVEVWLYCCSR